MVLENAGLAVPPEREGIAVIALGDAARSASVPLIAGLRRTCDVPVTTDYAGAKLATQLKRADRANARGALILGDDELQNGTLGARDLVLRTQVTLQGGSLEASLAAVRAWYADLPSPALVPEAV